MPKKCNMKNINNIKKLNIKINDQKQRIDYGQIVQDVQAGLILYRRYINMSLLLITLS